MEKTASNVMDAIGTGRLALVMTQIDNEAAECEGAYHIAPEYVQAAMKLGFSQMAIALIADERFDAKTAAGDCLPVAISLGYLQIAEQLISKGAPVNQRSEDLDHPLMLALDKEFLPLADKLVEAGAELSVRNPKGWTPLIWASITGREALVDYLLDRGADIHVCNDDGWNAITGA